MVQLFKKVGLSKDLMYVLGLASAGAGIALRNADPGRADGPAQ